MTQDHHAVVIEDFCFMRQGQLLAGLTQQEASWLQPLAIKKAPSGRALLLIHGFASSPAVYREMIHQLTDYDALFCPLLPGHGRSFDDFSETKATDWLTFIEKTFDDIAQHYEKIDVLGLSLGGLLACHLAKNRSINQLFLLAPALALTQASYIPTWMLQLLRYFGLRYITNRGGSLLNTNYSELTFRKLPLTCIYEIFRLVKTFEFTPFSSKTLVFLGKYDKVIRNQEVQAMINRLPDVSTIWLENSEHVLPLDNDFQQIIDKIRSM